MSSTRIAAALLAVALALPASPSLARPGDWGPGDWGPPSTWGRQDRYNPEPRTDDNRQGKVDVVRFVAEGQAGALGHGAIAVSADLTKDSRDTNLPAYEAAVVDRLIAAGYDTRNAPGNEAQIAELHITRGVLVPQELKHKPVSGEMDMGVSNRGTMMGMALNVDLTKPKKALLSTRLEARIRDKASGAVLWEGRADIATREDDPDWSEQKIAGRLADALFKGFPADAGEPVAVH